MVTERTEKMIAHSENVQYVYHYESRVATAVQSVAYKFNFC